MDILTFLVALSVGVPTPPWDYYNCATDTECQVQCEARDESDCDY